MRDVSLARNVRPSPIAGTWYPGTVQELTKTIDRFLSNVPFQPVPGQLIGLIAPHAGYIYSGQVAAYAYKQLERLRFDVVVVVSPLHRHYAGPFVVADYAFYETPLGLVEVDSELVSRLADRLSLSRLKRDEEHSLEIQLPFLQRMLGEFKLLPVMQGDQSLSASQALADSLVHILEGQEVLLVASTDLSHFYGYETAVKLDRVLITHIEAYDPISLSQALERGATEACGGGPVVSVMLAARALGANRAQTLRYANSGDVTGDHTRVVGYLAAALYRAND